MGNELMDLIVEINSDKFKKARFGIKDRSMREFIIKINEDKDYRDAVIDAMGLEALISDLKSILNDFQNMEKRLESFADSEDEELRKSYEALSDEGVMALEDRKDDLLKELVRKSIDDKAKELQMLKDKEKLAQLISGFKNNN